MCSAGGLSRRRDGALRRSTYVAPTPADYRNFRRKVRKGWAAHI